MEGWGLGPQETKTLAGSALGTGAALYLRWPGTIIRMLSMGGLGMGSGIVLGPDINAWFGLSMQASASIAALVTIPIALRVLVWIEKLDIGKLIRRR